MDVDMNGVDGDTSVYDAPDHSQAQTQPISQPSQPMDGVESDLDAQSWGLLISCVPGMERVRLLKSTRQIKIGRDGRNHVVCPWTCISAFHAVIEWNGLEDGASEVTITDNSTNGTFVMKQRIGRGHKRVLTDGIEISFGYAERPKTNYPEYRFTYRDLVAEKRELHVRYDLSARVGQGTFAMVFKALEKGTSRWVAVKVIRPTTRQNTAAPCPVSREIGIMKGLVHPNICTLLEVFENPNGSIDIVLEYMEGGDLFSYLKHTNNGTGLDDWMACHLTQQICQAMAYIHSNKITHRDLKPENILLTSGHPPILKIADFGLAKLVDEATALRTVCGTPSYIAPEIVNRLNLETPYTSIVDSWSVGAICFCMFTMRTPFPKVPIEQLEELIRKGKIDWASLNRSTATGSGKDFIRRLLEIDPDLRMTLDDARFHSWLVKHKPTYDLTYPDPAPYNVPSGTASLSSEAGDLSTVPQGAVHARAVTEDPYADYPQSPPTGTGGLETIAESGDLPVGVTNTGAVEWRQPRADPGAPPPIPGYPENDSIYGALPTPAAPAISGVLPAHAAPEASAIEQRQALPRGDSVARREYSERDASLYGVEPAAPLVLQPGPADASAEVHEADEGPRKRAFVEMHREGSSPLTSIDSPPPARKKKKEPKRDGKMRQEAEPSTAARKSTRPARRAKR